MITTRLARESDAPEIVALMGQLGYPATEALITQKLRLFETLSTDAAYLATLEDRVAGCISVHTLELFHAPGRLGRITSLVVDQSVRGSGVGIALVKAAEEFFRRDGCVRAEVTSGNHRLEAHEFYMAQGYQLDERRFMKYF